MVNYYQIIHLDNKTIDNIHIALCPNHLDFTIKVLDCFLVQVSKRVLFLKFSKKAYDQIKGTFNICCTCSVQGGFRNINGREVHSNEVMQSKLLRTSSLCCHFADFIDKRKLNTRANVHGNNRMTLNM